MSYWIDQAVKNARTLITLLLILMVGGALAYVRMPKESNPDVTLPIIYVSMSLEGISPNDAERLLLLPMEQKLRRIEGIKEMRSTGYLGGAYVLLEFEAGQDADKALRDVRERVDEATPELPAGIDPPSVNEVNFSLFPVLVVSLSGDVPERALLKLARDLRDKLEALANVLEVKIAGEREELAEVIIDPLRLESYGLSGTDISTLVGRSNRLVAAGQMDTGYGRFALQVPGLFEDAQDILDMPIKVSGDAVVRVRDVATLRRSFKDASSLARINGQPAIALEVSKRTGTNIIDTVEQVKAAVEEERAYWPAELRNAVQVTFSKDESNGIRDMVRDLQNNLISAVLLVMVVVIGALGWRSGLLVGAAIPGSFLMGLLLLSFFGLTINVVVLFSLILSVGMLVDGIIVLVEYADRKMAEGLTPSEAYRASAKHMAWPIFGAISTHMVAFMPLLFWPGVVGEFMKFLPITLTTVLGASYLMAMFFGPALGSVIGRTESGGSQTIHALADDSQIDLRALQGPVGIYVRILDKALKHPGLVILATFGLLIGSVVVYANERGGSVEFFPEVEPENAIINVHAQGNMSLEERSALVQEVERLVMAMNVETRELRSIYSTTSASSDTGQSGGNSAEDVIGSIQLEFIHWEERRKARDILNEIRERTAALPGIFVETQQQEAGPPVGKPVQLQLVARNPELLEPTLLQLREYLQSIEGVRDIEDSRSIPGIDWQIEIDRAQAAKQSVDVTAVGDSIQLLTKGMRFGTFRPIDSDEEIDIVVRYPEEYRTLDELDRMRIMTAAGGVPLSNFVERKAQPKVSLVHRIDGERTLSLKADVAEGILPSDVVSQIEKALPSLGIAPDVQVTFKGEDQEQRQSQEFLAGAFLAVLALIAMILMAQFNSFYYLLIIMSAVILSTIGVLIGLLVTGQNFGIVMTGLGIITLAGVVVQNNILLIDAYETIRKVVPTTREAVLKTGAQRLRPVFLTSVTLVLGLLPIMYGINIDFVLREVTQGAPATQWWTQLSTAVVFGLTFCTLLTLVVTPCALLMGANMQGWFRRRFRKAKEMSPPIPSSPMPAE